MNRSRLILWVVAAVAAIGVTTAAVTVANAGGGRDDVLSQDEVSRQLGEQTGAPPATGAPETSAPATPGPSGEGVSRTLRSQAAQLVASCAGAGAYLETWSPNPGYRVDEVVRGPAPQALLWVESDSFEDVQILVQCEGGEPVMTELVEPDDHGGDRDDDGYDDGDDRGGDRGRG
ncbi:MAG: hypothetical protein GEV12_01970 [Micromonosporaceae bacterium]|nr:hypothetical protein [Micromonosporaceae bacterium]